MCCGDPVFFDFDTVTGDFPDLAGIGEMKWPVIYDRGKTLIMVHSPVGTLSVLKDQQCKVIISGFSTSLDTCSDYLKDIKNNEANGNYETKHTFGSLRRNLDKIFDGLGLYKKFGLKVTKTKDIEGDNWQLIKNIKSNPLKYPILLTQALCCMGTEEKSDADRIISKIQDPDLPPDFRSWVDSCLADWVNMIHDRKGKNSILLLLGYRTGGGQKSAIHRLLKSTHTHNGKISTLNNGGITLYDYLKEMFGDNMGFVIHPAQLTNTNLQKYMQSEEGIRVKRIIQKLQ